MSRSTATRSILVWHVHGSWTESFVAGRHRCVIPVNDDQDAYGRGDDAIGDVGGIQERTVQCVAEVSSRQVYPRP